MPPSPYDVGAAKAAVTRVVKIITSSGALVFDKIYAKVNDPVVRVWPCGVVLLKSGELVELRLKRIIGRLNSSNGEIIKVDDGWLIADWNNNEVGYTHVNESSLQPQTLTLMIKTHHLFRSENRLFAVTERGLTEILFKSLGTKPIIAVGQTWGVMINSTKWFDGVGIQDAMGAMFLVVPFGEKSCTQIRVPELDGLRPVSAKAGNRYIVVIAADRQGQYHQIEFITNREYVSYKTSRSMVDSPDLNVSLLPKGVGASITEDGELTIFVPTSGVENKVSDKYVTTDIALANWEDRVVYIRKGEVWTVRLK